MPIDWNDNLKTGVADIDNQHKGLVVMLNRIGRFRCGKECFLEAFGELSAYVNTHFKTEEDYMLSINYPGYEEHKGCHDEFTENFKNFQEKIDDIEKLEDSHELGAEISDFACDWLVNHYSKEDVQLADYIKSHT